MVCVIKQDLPLLNTKILRSKSLASWKRSSLTNNMGFTGHQLTVLDKPKDVSVCNNRGHKSFQQICYLHSNYLHFGDQEQMDYHRSGKCYEHYIYVWSMLRHSKNHHKITLRYFSFKKSTEIQHFQSNKWDIWQETSFLEHN